MDWLEKILTRKVFILVLAVGLVFVAVHWLVAENDGEKVRFIAAVIGAIGVLYGLLLSAKSMFANAEATRSAQAIRLIERWSDPAFNKNRITMRDLISQGEQADLLCDLDEKTENNLIAVSNFFEEMGTSVRLGRVDVEHLQVFFGATVHTIYDKLRPWIERKRESQSAAFSEFEKLAKRWSGKEPSGGTGPAGGSKVSR